MVRIYNPKTNHTITFKNVIIITKNEPDRDSKIVERCVS